MGGYCSGRMFGKATTSGFLRLDVRQWQREGLLTPGKSFIAHWTCNGEKTASVNVQAESGRIILSYRNRNDGGEWESLEYPVYLDLTGCHYGGGRVWFLCPAQGCGRRVAILYGGKVFACRHCYNLAYPVQRETDCYRAVRRADKIRERLGWEHGILNLTGDKPKGMHWRTYWRLFYRYGENAMFSMEAIHDTVNRRNKRASDLLEKHEGIS